MGGLVSSSARASVGGPMTGGWLSRWHALRDRLLASPRFHRWAAASPLTRPFARARARALFDLCAGFVYSQTLYACVKLRLFEMLADGPQRADVLAARLGLELEPTVRLLNAAASLDLAARRGEADPVDPGAAVFGLGELGAALRGAPGVAEMVEHHALLYADLADPVALLKGETTPQLRDYWAYVDRPREVDQDEAASYSRLMAASLPFVAEETLDAYPMRRHRRLLDVGGGEGVFLTAAARRAPRLELMLFDLPAVAERARARLDAEGLASRASVFGGSFFDDPLPTGADVISLIRVLYDHDDRSALAILKAVRKALPADGRLVISEPMAGTPGAGPIGEAYFGFYLLAMGGGRPRTPRDHAALLEAAGFQPPRLAPTRRPLLARVLVSTPA